MSTDGHHRPLRQSRVACKQQATAPFPPKLTVQACLGRATETIRSRTLDCSCAQDGDQERIACNAKGSVIGCRWYRSCVPSQSGVAFFFCVCILLQGVISAFAMGDCRYRTEIAQHVVRAAAYRTAGYPTRAQTEYVQALAVDSTCADLWVLLAQCHQELGQVDSSIAAAERALSLDSSLLEAYNVLADAYALRSPTRAAYFALGALRLQPTLSAQIRAAYFLRAVDTAQAISLLQDVVRVLPVEEIADDLVELCLNYRDTTQAIALMRRLLFEFPDRVELALKLASLSVQRQQWDSAWIFLRAATYHMEAADVSTAVGRWLDLVDGSTPTGILLETARFLLQRNDLSCSHAIVLAQYLVNRNRPVDARQLLVHAFRLRQLQRNEALAAVELLGEWEGPVAVRALLMTRDSTYGDRWVPLALYYLARRFGGAQPAELNAYLDKALTRDSTDPAVLFYAAYRADSLGQRSRAIQLYERILFYDPANATAANNLAYILAETGERLSFALELAERALAADSTNPSFLDTYGWVLFRQGRYGESLPYLERAVSLHTGQSATLFEHLGDNYDRLGNTEKARLWWRRAYEADPQRRYLLDRLR